MTTNVAAVDLVRDLQQAVVEPVLADDGHREQSAQGAGAYPRATSHVLWSRW
jgi:hypothetical protein